ncbi:MAG: MBL fold metallo-hydrolase [Gammaproteobacteria bacterium]|nr:MBL fold metallo-hydrolase [Gammaproteobacteria bacterium]
MRLSEHIYMVGGGLGGFGLSDKHDSNVYLITDGTSATLIDAGLGPGTDRIIENIEEDGVDPASIERLAVTHPHADHAGGCAALKKALGVEVYVPTGAKHWLEEADEDGINLTRAKNAGGYYPEYRLEPVKVDFEVSDGDKVPAGTLQLETVWTPGHTSKHVCFVLRTGRTTSVFSGDFVFYQGRILQINTPDASLPDYSASMDRFRDFGIDGLYPGHGAISVSGGQSHVDRALAAFDRLAVPPNLNS